MYIEFMNIKNIYIDITMQNLESIYLSRVVSL